jgi:hypothetical protein
MGTRIDAWLKKLEGLSNEELDRSAERAARSEKKTAAWVTAHIAEISKRRLEETFAYKGLTDYVTRRLGFSEAEAGLRVYVGVKAAQFPQLIEALAESRITLSVAAVVSRHLTPSNVEQVLGDVTGKTKLEAQEYIAALSPKPVLGPSVRRQPAARGGEGGTRPSAEASTEAGGTLPLEGGTTKDLEPGRELEVSPPGPAQPVGPSEPAPSSPPAEASRAQEDRRPSPNILEPATAEVYNWRFSAGREFREKFERLAEVLGVKNPVKNMEKVLSEAIEFTLQHKDPQRRHARRVERKARLEAREAESRQDCGVPPCPDKVSDGAAEPPERVVAPSAERPEAATQEAAAEPGGSPGQEKAASRHVPVALRDETLERAG